MDVNVARVLIVDDDQELSAMLSALLQREGLISLVAPDGETALEMVPAARPDLLLVDVKMPGIDGMEVLKRVKEMEPQLPVVLITAYAEVPASVAAMRAGAFDYLAKPFYHAEVIRVVRAALAERERRHKSYADREPREHCLRVMMGPSDAVTQIIREVNRVAQSDFSVVIQGETGAGPGSAPSSPPRQSWKRLCSGTRTPSSSSWSVSPISRNGPSKGCWTGPGPKRNCSPSSWPGRRRAWGPCPQGCVIFRSSACGPTATRN
jgi:FixJ family two-component response regulator